MRSPSTRRAWIEISPRASFSCPARSPSTRRAWIEIQLLSEKASRRQLSPSTRRAWIEIPPWLCAARIRAVVALHPEGVDRNLSLFGFISRFIRSPSTRRAWIEIKAVFQVLNSLLSPSTRRAWIEIPILRTCIASARVALHPEGVDRNPLPSPPRSPRHQRRPPPGGRG